MVVRLNWTRGHLPKPERESERDVRRMICARSANAKKPVTLAGRVSDVRFNEGERR